MVVLLFGPPGCGKGTQTPRIRALLDVPAIATGDMLRAEIRSGTRLGRQVDDVIREGRFAGDTLMNRLVLRRLLQPDCREGFLLDGYPRTVAQAGFLDRVIAKLGLPAPLVIQLRVPDAVLVERISGRRQCPFCQATYNIHSAPPPVAGRCACGALLYARDDDRAEVVRRRLEIFRANTDPVLATYADRHAIDGDRPPDAVFADIEAAIERRAAVTAHAGLAIA